MSAMMERAIAALKAELLAQSRRGPFWKTEVIDYNLAVRAVLEAIKEPDEEVRCAMIDNLARFNRIRIHGAPDAFRAAIDAILKEEA